jgi:GTPase SAR1 family protein
LCIRNGQASGHDPRNAYVLVSTERIQPSAKNTIIAIMSSLEAKIVVLGSQGVGKTSLLMRYCKGAFDPSQITSTVGASFLTKRVVDADTDTLVRLQIWDTGNIPPFPPPTNPSPHFKQTIG